MDGIASSLAKPAQLRRDAKARPRSEAKRARIVALPSGILPSTATVRRG